jgi:PH (Pleckstrin Homology) domain-containing protein
VPGQPGQPDQKDTLVLRAPWRTLVGSYGLTLAVATVVAFVYPEWRLLYVVVGILVVVGVLLRLRSSVTLTPEGLDVVSVRSWQLPWSEVTGVETRQRPPWGSGRVLVRDGDRSRELLALRGIGSNLDRPRALADVVESWWHKHSEPSDA